jgi:DNA-binding transcriptional LysR family regulator
MPPLSGRRGEKSGVEITLLEDNSDRLIEAVRGGALDAAVIAYDRPPPGLRLHVVTHESITAAVGVRHELVAVSSIELAQLRDRPLISLPVGTGIRSILDAACAVGGFRPRVAFEAGSPSPGGRRARSARPLGRSSNAPAIYSPPSPPARGASGEGEVFDDAGGGSAGAAGIGGSGR